MEPELKAEFERLHRRLDELETRLVEPLLLTYPAAAKRLGVGLTKLKQLVAAREIRTSRLGRAPMVPSSELARVAAPPSERAQVETARRRKAWVPIARRPR